MAQCEDGTEYLDVAAWRLEYNPQKIDHSILPEAEVRQKVAKTRNWAVCKSWIDKENKLFCYDVAVNAETSELKNVTFDEVCKDFHWSSFKLINNDQTIKWKHDESWDEEMDKIFARCKKASMPETESALAWRSVK